MDNNPLEYLVHHLLLSVRCAELEPLRDKQLLQRYIGQCDELALSEVIRRHGDMVWAVCQRVLGPGQEAKDVYQVTFLKLVRQAAFVRNYESVASCLHRLAHSVAIHTQGKRERRHACEERRAKMCEEGYTDPRHTRDLTEILDQEVGYLPEKCQSPIILCYLEGLTPEQAARRINISTHCLKRRLAEGRQRLHQRLSKRGINLDSPMLVAGLTENLHGKQVPPRLMEKTLHMVRILTQSNNALNAENLPGGAMTLAKNVLKTWTLKAKLLLALLLTMVMVAGGGMITYSGWRIYRGEQPQERMPGPGKKVRETPKNQEAQRRSSENPTSLCCTPKNRFIIV